MNYRKKWVGHSIFKIAMGVDGSILILFLGVCHSVCPCYYCHFTDPPTIISYGCSPITNKVTSTNRFSCCYIVRYAALDQVALHHPLMSVHLSRNQNSCHYYKTYLSEYKITNLDKLSNKSLYLITSARHSALLGDY